VRSALAGTALSVLAVVAALTFGANLLHLVHSPPLYGQRWDAAIDVQFPSPPITPARATPGWATSPASLAGRSGITAPSNRRPAHPGNRADRSLGADVHG